MDLTTTVAGLELEHPIMNAAGTCKNLADVMKLTSSAASAIVLGSITKERRDGNSGNVYHCEGAYSVNSLGMPNPGLAATERDLPVMARMAHDAGKKLIVSVAGFSPEEYVKLAAMALNARADMVELNLGCPNVWEKGKQKRIPSFDPQLIWGIVHQVRKTVGKSARFSIKLSPFSDPVVLEKTAQLFGETPRRAEFSPDAVVTSNTFPNAYAVDEKGTPRISNGGLAGFAGPAFKPIALGQVRQLRTFLTEALPIIGVGGISTGADVRDCLRAGATAVQLATAYLERGERVFSEILAQYVETMES